MLAACFVMLFGGMSYAKLFESAVPDSTARDTQTDGQIGLGFNSQISGNVVSVDNNNVAVQSVTSLAVRDWATKYIGYEGMLGFGFGNNTSIIDIGAKILATIKKEQHMRTYGFGLLGFESSSITVGGKSYSSTGVTIGAGLGAEFFFTGLPNLGFGVEAGIGYNSSTEIFSTQGSMTDVGIRYYFK